MTLHGVAIRAASKSYRFEQPSCPRCGDAPFLPEAAEFAGEGRIRHSWICEGCGHVFQTAVKLPGRAKSSVN
jgi:ribosomal protein S27AE